MLLGRLGGVDLIIVVVCMGMGIIEFPWVPYGIPTGMGIEMLLRMQMGWEWE